MKILLTIVICLLSFKSNGQKKDINKDALKLIRSSDSIMRIGFLSKDTSLLNLYTSNSTGSQFMIKPMTDYAMKLTFMRDGNISAYQKAGSDTLVITDSVFSIYNFKIRYIKIGEKVYPLKH